MKFTLKKAVCFVTMIACMVILSVGIAADENHVHTENCVYHCERDEICVTEKEPIHTHIDHEDSEDCRYSCSHAMNHHRDTGHMHDWTVEEWIEDFKAVTNDTEMVAFLAEYYDMSVTENDVANWREEREAARKSAHDSQYARMAVEYSAAEADMTYEEKLAFWTDFTGDSVLAEQILEQQSERANQVSTQRYNRGDYSFVATNSSFPIFKKGTPLCVKKSATGIRSTSYLCCRTFVCVPGKLL